MGDGRATHKPRRWLDLGPRARERTCVAATFQHQTWARQNQPFDTTVLYHLVTQELAWPSRCCRRWKPDRYTVNLPPAAAGSRPETRDESNPAAQSGC